MKIRSNLYKRVTLLPRSLVDDCSDAASLDAKPLTYNGTQISMIS